LTFVFFKDLPLKYIRNSNNRYGEENFVNVDNALKNLIIEDNKTIIGIIIYCFKYDDRKYSLIIFLIILIKNIYYLLLNKTNL